MARDYDDLRNNESPFTDDMDYKELMDSAASRGDMESRRPVRDLAQR